MNQKNNLSSPIQGFFIAMSNETFKKGNLIETGRFGVYYKPEDLVSIINGNPVLKKDTIHIVEVQVPEDAIFNKNCVRFGIKSKKRVKILNIHPFEKLLHEVMRRELVEVA